MESADDGGNFFQINSSGGALVHRRAGLRGQALDAGGNNVYNVTVKVTDAGRRSATRDVAVTVTNVNEAPVITTDSDGLRHSLYVCGENTET